MLLAATVIVLVGGFILLSPGSGKDKSPAATTPVATAPATTSGEPAATATTAAPEPAATTIVVKGGKPAGGVQTVKASKGDRVSIVVSSPDTTSEVHFHGYDLKRDLTAGGEVRFDFDAKLEGIFEMELEDTAVQIAKVEVSPN